MSETLAAIGATLKGVLAGHCTDKDALALEAGTWNGSLWDALHEAGVFLAPLPEAGGGLGLSLTESVFIARTAAAHAAPVPIAETLLATWLWGTARNEAAGRTATVHVSIENLRVEERSDGALALSGVLSHVPWGRHADTILLAVPHDAGTRLVRLEPTHGQLMLQVNVADEPRDSLTIEHVDIPSSHVASIDIPCFHVQTQMALMRAAQIVGAMEEIVAHTVQYANERVQFGRPIARFQAIQHQIAVMAELVAMSALVLEQAAMHAASVNHAPLAWAAKALASENAGHVASTAHQVLGAMGFTRENRLQLFTRRLFAWRNECGNEGHWYEKLGAAAISKGGDGLWPWLASVSPSA